MKMSYLCNDRSIIYREDSLQMDRNTYVGTITENGSTIRLPLMQCLPAQEASRDKYGCHTYATTEASYIGKTAYTQRRIQIPVGTNMEDGTAPTLEHSWYGVYLLVKQAVRVWYNKKMSYPIQWVSVSNTNGCWHGRWYNWNTSSS